MTDMKSDALTDDALLASRDRQSFDAGFAAGSDWTGLARDYARKLVESAVRDRIDDEWLKAARDYLKKTAPPTAVSEANPEMIDEQAVKAVHPGAYAVHARVGCYISSAPNQSHISKWSLSEYAHSESEFEAENERLAWKDARSKLQPVPETT